MTRRRKPLPFDNPFAKTARMKRAEKFEVYGLIVTGAFIGSVIGHAIYVAWLQ